ncbi:MAG: GNAT family N-acetyltransferase [Planctomycetes bacterium]|nr:GNAT family N-acetyltransferase [Planctomycetota bacterium]
MPVMPTQLVDCLEDVMFRVPAGEASITPLTIPGLRGRATPISTPYTNLVGIAEADVEIADETIDRVIDEFRGRNQMFGWLIGPRTPPDLAARLEAKGFSRFEEFAGLALMDLNRPVATGDGITIHEAGPEDERQFASLLSAAFGLPPEMVEFLCRILYFAETDIRCRNYFAYRPGVDEPIGVASTIDDPNSPTIILGGSAVLEAHRGMGAYKALVARRLADALAEGIEAVVIQAVRSTSAPICRTLGFHEVCAQSLYAWGAE